MTCKKRRMIASTLLLLRSARGLTVLELLFVLVIFGIATGAIFGLMKIGVKSAGFNTRSLQSQVQVRAALDNMVDEARWADRVWSAAANTVTLHVPTGTPFYSGGEYRVTFAYDSATKTVTRTRTWPNPPDATFAMAYNVAGLTLSYYGSDGDLLTFSDVTNMAMVEFRVTTNTGTIGRILAGNATLRARQP